MNHPKDDLMMMQSNRLRFACFGVLFAISTVTGAAYAQSVDTIMDRLEAKYADISSITAAFTQTISSHFEEEITSNGTLTVAGEKYRFESNGQIYATNGQTSWVLVEQEETFMISDVEEDNGAVSPTDLFGDFETSYEVELDGTARIDGAVHHVIRLAPKTPDAMFMEATVWMRDRDDMVTQMRYTDFNDRTYFFKMTNIEVNVALEPGTFELEAPEGYEVIDMREM